MHVSIAFQIDDGGGIVDVDSILGSPVPIRPSMGLGASLERTRKV
jgi:hypothetical protein